MTHPRLPRGLEALAVAAALASATTACGTAEVRRVTHVSTWSGPKGDYFYVAYAEDADLSRVKLCQVLEDNTIACKDQPAVDAVLNAR